MLGKCAKIVQIFFACRAKAVVVQFYIPSKRGIEIKNIIGIDGNVILTGRNQLSFVAEHSGEQGAVQRVDALTSIEETFSLLERLQKNLVKIVHGVNVNFIDTEVVIVCIFEV